MTIYTIVIKTDDEEDFIQITTMLEAIDSMDSLRSPFHMETHTEETDNVRPTR